jgi:SpoVK/Ycf46/Vps4 family AAA+-type ATPase
MAQSPIQTTTTSSSSLKPKVKSRLEQINELKKSGINLDGVRFPKHNLNSVKGQDDLISTYVDDCLLINSPSLSASFLDFTGENCCDSFVIFEGPTGSGKTHLSEAIAGSIHNAIYVNIKAKNIKNSEYVNVTQRNLEVQFERFRRLTQLGYFVVAVMDEIEVLVTKRSANTDQATMRQENDLVNRVLTFIDEEVRKPRNYMFIGTTNLIEHIDGAAIRPGRFMPVHVPYPSEDGVRYIVKHYLTQLFQLSNILYSQPFEDRVTNLFIGKSPAGIKNTLLYNYKRAAKKYHIIYARSNPKSSFKTWIYQYQDKFVDDWFMGIVHQHKDVILDR